MSDKNEKTAEMKKYEAETGKKAIWRGVITEGFKKWLKGEKIYVKNKERINILVSEEKKNKWQKFASKNSIPTVSKLIRQAVDFYIDSRQNFSKLQKFDMFSHDLKEKLSTIKGFSQILIEEYKDVLSWDIISQMKEILDQSLNLERMINDALSFSEEKMFHYDVLIVDDDPATIYLLTTFFKKKGYSCREASLGSDAIEILQKSVPKVILLDIVLPEMGGDEICKKIKSDEKLKEIPVFYITAIPEIEVDQKMKNTGANGYFLKPFNMLKFNNVLNYL